MVGQIITDVLFVLVAVVLIVVSGKRGLIGSFFKFAKVLLAIVITYFTGHILTSCFAEWFVSGWFAGRFSERFASMVASGETAPSFDAFMEKVPALLRNLLPIDALRDAFSSFSGSGEAMARAFGAEIEKAMTTFVSTALGYIATFILSLILVIVVAAILKLIFKLPVLRQVNVIFGVLWGIALSYLVLSLAACILNFFVGEEFIRSTAVLQFFCRFGLFTNFS